MPQGKSIILFLFVLFTINLAEAKKTQPQVIEPTLKIGALLDLSKYDSQTGPSIKAGLEMAVKQFNKTQQRKRSKKRVELVIKNTTGNPEYALELLELLKDQGIQLVVGPQIESEIQEVQSFAKKHKMILLSPTSVSSVLSKSGDNLFRFLPGNQTQAQAVAQALLQDGVQASIVIHPDNQVGTDGAKVLKNALAKSKNKVLSVLSYQTDHEGFQILAAEILKQVSASREKYSLDQVAVVMVGLTPVSDVFNHANRMALLKKLRWYNASLTVGFSPRLPKTDVASFASMVSYRTSAVGVKPEGRVHRLIPQLLKNKLKHQLDPVAFVAYDLMWVAAEAYFQAGLYDLKSFQTTLMSVSESHRGLTGSLSLNKAGDRQMGLLQGWTIKKRGSSYYWAKSSR